MFNQVGWGEIAVLLLVGLFVFGPERLPKAARDAGRLLRQLRTMASGLQEDLRSELGPELADLDLRSLNPRTFVQKNLFSDDEDDPIFPSYLTKRTSLDKSLFDMPDVKSLLSDTPAGGLPKKTTRDSAPTLTKRTPANKAVASAEAPAEPQASTGFQPSTGAQPGPAAITPFDADAT